MQSAQGHEDTREGQAGAPNRTRRKACPRDSRANRLAGPHSTGNEKGRLTTGPLSLPLVAGSLRLQEAWQQAVFPLHYEYVGQEESLSRILPRWQYQNRLAA